MFSFDGYGTLLPTSGPVRTNFYPTLHQKVVSKK
jgi:hypothetical protein